MAGRQAIHRVLDATEQTPEQTLSWGSDEEQAVWDSPMNTLRLANFKRPEAAGTTPGMTTEKYSSLYGECLAASNACRIFTL